jgi:hypothetical protein
MGMVDRMVVHPRKSGRFKLGKTVSVDMHVFLWSSVVASWLYRGRFYFR